MHNRRKDFLDYLRHMLLIKWHICKYTIKMLIGLAKGTSFEPSFNLNTFMTNMDHFFETGNLNDFLPIGPYEYHEMIKYLVKINRTIKFERRERSSVRATSYIIEFSQGSVPMEDLLYQAAQDCGFSVVDEVIEKSYWYKIKSTF